jgi:hypothetical protein
METLGLMDIPGFQEILAQTGLPAIMVQLEILAIKDLLVKTAQLDTQGHRVIPANLDLLDLLDITVQKVKPVPKIPKPDQRVQLDLPANLGLRAIMAQPVKQVSLVQRAKLVLSVQRVKPDLSENAGVEAIQEQQEIPDNKEKPDLQDTRVKMVQPEIRVNVAKPVIQVQQPILGSPAQLVKRAILEQPDQPDQPAKRDILVQQVKQDNSAQMARQLPTKDPLE